ncbi:3-deoxy-D-manno-octulosonic acid transferase [Candidatus Sarmatiella mevalonica]|uniref:3-deoxy-D-manno-octulosonic acid transferase n=1 Tax=Candidatus Sarmatiella mevalonica TaxID=2770581 RepID=UPI001FC8271E|nr:glycosyltransferase N-terminal domain-containing protein [Candidatus Sarmatiella mevalonica]
MSKFGFLPYPKPKENTQLIWIHAASVGETKIALSFICHLHKAQPKYSFLLTSTSHNVISFLASQQDAISSWGVELIHQFLPIDLPFFIHRFLGHYRPILGLFVESELWLNTIKISASYTKLALISARMSDKSYKFWQKFRPLITPTLQSFNTIITQSPRDEEKFATLGAKSKEMGNLKFCNLSQADEAIVPLTEDNKILFASTHAQDVEFLRPVVQYFKNTKHSKNDNQLYFIDAPRYLEQINNHLHWCDKVIDEFGKMDYWYSVSKIIFIGGSCAFQGGHNPLEAAIFGRIIICGPDMSNYAQICEQMLQNNAIIQAHTAQDVINAIERCMMDEEMYEQYSTNARNFVLMHKKRVMDQYINSVLAML